VGVNLPRALISGEEKQLIDALKRQDREALRVIFTRYHARLCRVSQRIVNDPDEAKDVVQDVFIKLWENSHRLHIEHSFEAYLRRAVVNTSLNHLERKSRQSPLDLAGGVVERGGENNADQHQAQGELSQHIDAAVKNLPARTRAVFVLIRYEQMSYKDVAGQMNISSKAVEKEMMRALSFLRAALREFLPVMIASLLFS